MRDSSEELASWASIVGSAITLIGFLQSQAWITILGAAFVGVTLAALFYLKHERQRLGLANITIEGISLDGLNLANLRRRRNKSLLVQRAYHLAKIEGRDVAVAWRYDGICQAEKESRIEFSIDTETSLPFDQLDCFAFDLVEDPKQLHKIRPLLVGSDGLSKKIAIPLLKPVLKDQPFSILLNCNLRECVGEGTHYHASSLSFAQARVKQLTVHLVFVRRTPDWVRVYELDKSGTPDLVGELRASKDDGETCEYVEVTENVPGQSVRVYFYQLAASTLSNPSERGRLT